MDGLADPLRASGKLTAPLTLLRLLRPMLARSLAGLACAAVVAGAGAAYAYLSGPLVQLLLSGGRAGASAFAPLLPGTLASERPLVAVAVLLVALAALKGVAQLLQTALLAGAIASVGRALRVRTFTHLLRLPLSEHRRLARGDLLARLLDDVSRVQQAAIEAPLSLLRESLAALLLLLVAFVMAPRLAVVAIVALPLVGLVVAFVGRRVRRSATRGQEALGQLADRAQQGLASVREVKSCGAEQRESALLAAKADQTARWALRQQLIRAVAPLFNEISAALALGAVVLYAGSLIAAKTLDPARLLSFLTAVLLVYRPIKGIGNAVSQAAAGQASIERVADLLSRPAEPVLAAAAPLLPPLARAFELSGVAFRYAESWVLRDLDLTLPLGKFVAVSGASGAGKSTLVDIVCGLEPPAEGELLWDGEPVSREMFTALRARAALVPQQPLLFSGSVAENLRYGAPAAEENELWGALEAAGLAERCRRLAAGLETPLGADGGGLSVGEVQRLALARALLRDARLLVLDEPTAALDAVAEAQLLETLQRLRAGRAILVVSHRTALLRAADCHLELRDGRLVAADDDSAE